jgi:hypothetical protein
MKFLREKALALTTILATTTAITANNRDGGFEPTPKSLAPGTRENKRQAEYTALDSTLTARPLEYY